MRESDVKGKVVNVYQGDHNLQAKREKRFKIARVRIERFKCTKASTMSLRDRRINEIKTLSGKFCECTVLEVPKNRIDDSIQIGERYIFNVDLKDLEAVAR